MIASAMIILIKVFNSIVNVIHSQLIKCGREVNIKKTKWVIEKIKSSIDLFESENNKKAKIACLGLSFKPNIDDLRESPAVEVVEELMLHGLRPIIVEPNISHHSQFTLFDLETAIEESDIIFILVKHDQFISIKRSDKKVIDFCGALQS